jgi:hypothetical protein
LDVRKEVEKSGLGLERFLEVVNFMAERRDGVFQVSLDLGWDRDAFGRHADIFAGGSVGTEGEEG